MPQIINEEPGLGYRLGTGLGSGLSNALSNLTNLKFQELASRNQQMAQQRQRSESSALLQKFGLSPEASDYVSTLPPKEQWAAVQELSGLGALGGLQQQQAPDSMAQLQPVQQETSRPLSNVLGLMGGRQGPQSVQELLSFGRAPQQLGLPQQQLPPQAAAQPQAAPVQQQPEVAPKVAQSARQMPAAVSESLPSSRENPRPVPPAEVQRPITPANQIALKRQLREQAALQKEVLKVEQATAKQKHQEQVAIDKETLPFYRDTEKAKHAAEQSDLILNRMENLVKKGNLPFAAMYRLFNAMEGVKISSATGAAGGSIAGLKYTGTPWGALIGGIIGSLAEPASHLAGGVGLQAQRLLRPDTEEFEKLTVGFIREAKNIFGARVTNQELQVFLQGIPSLAQTDNGKQRIINNMKSLNKAVKIRANAMEQIIKANGGKRPANLETLVDEYTKSSMDALADQFMQGIGEGQQVPQLQSQQESPLQQQVRNYLATSI